VKLIWAGYRGEILEWEDKERDHSAVLASDMRNLLGAGRSDEE